MPPPVGLNAVTLDSTSESLAPLPEDSASDRSTLRESGVPPARSDGASELSFSARGGLHAEAALTACARAEASLNSLIRTIRHAAATLENAAEAEADVQDEVESLRALLLSADEEQRALKQRFSILEHTLERTRREAEQERNFLIDQADVFIAGLCTDQEETVAELGQRLATLEASLRGAREETEAQSNALRRSSDIAEELELRLDRAETQVSRLTEERDYERDSVSSLELQLEEARAAATKAARERDQLRGELLNSRSSSENGRQFSFNDTLRDPNGARTPPGGIAVAVPEQDTPLVSATKPSSTGERAKAEASTSRSSALRRSSVPPEELRRALTDAPPPREGSTRAASSKPPLRQKPDASTRPLIGYSLAGDSVPEKQSTPLGSRIPER